MSDGSNASLPVVCRKLRTKRAFGSFAAGSEDWRTGDASTDVYWCLDTMETWGSDENLAHPHHCGPGRVCYRSCAEDEDIA